MSFYVVEEYHQHRIIDNVEGVAECMEGVVEEGDEEGVVEEGDEVSAEVEDMEGVEPVAVRPLDTPDGVAPGPPRVQEEHTKAEVVHLTPGLLGLGVLFNCSA